MKYFLPTIVFLQPVFCPVSSVKVCIWSRGRVLYFHKAIITVSSQQVFISKSIVRYVLFNQCVCVCVRERALFIM